MFLDGLPILNESYYGKINELQQCERLLNRIQQQVTRTPGWNASYFKENQRLMSILKTLFNFEELVITWEPSSIYPSGDPRIGSVPLGAFKVDKADFRVIESKTGPRFRTKKNKIVWIKMDNALFTQFKLNESEALALILYYIGQHFDISQKQYVLYQKYMTYLKVKRFIENYIYTSITLFVPAYIIGLIVKTNGMILGLLTSIVLFPSLAILHYWFEQLLAPYTTIEGQRKFVKSLLDDIRINTDKYKKITDKTRDELLIYEQICVMLAVSKELISLIDFPLTTYDTIIKIPILLVERILEPYLVKHPETPHARDLFVARYGYGNELLSATDKLKLNKHKYLGDRIPVIRTIRAINTAIIERLKHPESDDARIESMLGDLRTELNAHDNLPRDMRRSLIRDIKTLEKRLRYKRTTPLPSGALHNAAMFVLGMTTQLKNY